MVGAAVDGIGIGVVAAAVDGIGNGVVEAGIDELVVVATLPGMSMQSIVVIFS